MAANIPTPQTPKATLEDCERRRLAEQNRDSGHLVTLSRTLYVSLLADAAALPSTLAALAESRKAAEWRPIETAPKDGTPIVALGYPCHFRHHLFACITFWANERQPPAHIDGWFFSSPGYADAFDPIAWLPLPAAPTKCLNCGWVGEGKMVKHLTGESPVCACCGKWMDVPPKDDWPEPGDDELMRSAERMGLTDE